MPKTKTPPVLAWGEYLSVDELKGFDTQTSSARKLFMETVQRVCPEFFERLRDDIYPTFANLAQKKREPWEGPEYWKPGWTLDTWQQRSDREDQLTPHLRKLAQAFNADEDWVLEGVLQVLWLWQKRPNLRKDLDTRGCFPIPGGSLLISGEEAQFSFEDEGWQPQVERWAVWRDRVQGCFEKELSAYKEKLCSLAEKRGAVPAYSLQDEQCFEWLALYQCKGQRLEEIRELYPMTGDKTTIWKGIEKAAHLAGIKVRPRSHKLKNP